MSVNAVANPTVGADDSVLDATPQATTQPSAGGAGSSPPTPPTRNGSPPHPKGEHGGDAGSTRTANGSASSSQTYRLSAGRSNGSKRRWPKPKTVKQFAAQINEVATLVLNGEIELEQARVYSGLVRTVAQSVSLETSRARFLQQAPDLRLDEGEQ